MVRQVNGDDAAGRHDALRYRDGYVVDREQSRLLVRKRRGGRDQAHRDDGRRVREPGGRGGKAGRDDRVKLAA